jgi:hypothetical protein
VQEVLEQPVEERRLLEVDGVPAARQERKRGGGEVGMARFMSRFTSRQGSSSSPDMMSVGTSMRAISAVRS